MLPGFNELKMYPFCTVQCGVICHLQQPGIRGNMDLKMYYTISRNANGMHKVRNSSDLGRLSP